jgi:hypothetical protein
VDVAPAAAVTVIPHWKAQYGQCVFVVWVATAFNTDKDCAFAFDFGDVNWPTTHGQGSGRHVSN